MMAASRRRRRLVIAALAGIVIGAVLVAGVAGQRRGECLYVAHDGVFVVDIDHMRVVMHDPAPRGVRGMHHAGEFLYLADERGVHRLSASTLAHQVTYAEGIYDAVMAIGTRGQFVALEHPGDNPSEAHGFHALELYDEAGKLSREWRLPPSAHEILRVEGSGYLHALRQEGRELETIDLLDLERDSRSHRLAERADEPELALCRTALASDDRVWVFENDLGATGAGERIFLWELDADGTPIQRRATRGLAAYPRAAALVADGMWLLHLGRELARFDPQAAQLLGATPIEERSFGLALDAAGRRAVVVHPDGEKARGIVMLFDALTLRRIDLLFVPARVAQVVR